MNGCPHRMHRSKKTRIPRGEARQTRDIFYIWCTSIPTCGSSSLEPRKSGHSSSREFRVSPASHDGSSPSLTVNSFPCSSFRTSVDVIVAENPFRLFTASGSSSLRMSATSMLEPSVKAVAGFLSYDKEKESRFRSNETSWVSAARARQPSSSPENEQPPSSAQADC